MNFLFANSVEDIQSNVDKLNEDVSKLTKFLDNALEKLIDFGFSIIVAIIRFM